MRGAFEALLGADHIAVASDTEQGSRRSAGRDGEKHQPGVCFAGLGDPVGQRLPQIGAGVRQRARLVDRVLALPLRGRVVAFGVVEDDVVERIDADGEIILVVHPLQGRQQGVVDLSQIAKRGAGGAEGRCGGAGLGHG